MCGGGAEPEPNYYLLTEYGGERGSLKHYWQTLTWLFHQTNRLTCFIQHLRKKINNSSKLKTPKFHWALSYVDITDYCKPLSNNISLLLLAQKIPIDFNPVITSSFVKFSHCHKASKLGLFLVCKIPALCHRIGWLFFCLKKGFPFPCSRGCYWDEYRTGFFSLNLLKLVLKVVKAIFSASCHQFLGKQKKYSLWEKILLVFGVESIPVTAWRKG